MKNITDRPLAAEGLISYRCKNNYGWTMIGAKDDEDALQQAKLSDAGATRAGLQVWDRVAQEYVDLKPLEKFIVAFEATGFTNDKDLSDKTLPLDVARYYLEKSSKKGTLRKDIVSVLGGRISEDDAQGESDIHVFVRIELLVEAVSESAAEQVKPPRLILESMTDLITGGAGLDLEENSWEVVEVSSEEEWLDEIAANMPVTRG